MNLLVSYSEMAVRAPAPGGRQSKALLRFALAGGLVAADCAAIVLSFLAAGLAHAAAGGVSGGVSGAAAVDGIVVGGGFGITGAAYLLGAFLPIYLVSAGMAGSYAGPVLLKRGDALARGLSALVIAASVAMTVMFFLKAGATFSRFQFGAGLATCALALPLARCLFVGFASRRLGHSLYSVVELRDGPRPPGWARRRQGALSAEGPMGVPAGAASFDTSSFFDPGNPTPGSLDRLARLVAGVDRVVVSCPEDSRAAWAHVLQGMNVHGEMVLPSVGDVRMLGVGSYAGMATLLVGRGPLTLAERVSKRLVDLGFALAGLVLLWPLMLGAALAIRLTSPGPVLFRQARIGRQNRLFHIWKFRSMHVAACDGEGAASTARGDARVTPVGRFIRATSIDELPQLFNVLLGHMSIVGPRPHAVGSKAENLLFWEIDSRYWHRHACKPGLTGLAQVRGYRGATTRVQDITNRIAADLEYLAQWSLWRDFIIIFQTIKVILHRNAY